MPQTQVWRVLVNSALNALAEDYPPTIFLVIGGVTRLRLRAIRVKTLR